MGTIRFSVLNRIFAALVLISILAFGQVGRASAGSIIYVKAGAIGLHNGTSWANAYAKLQPALSAAVLGQQIWVAKGTYKPTLEKTLGDARSVTFSLKDGVAIYGGFAGTETKLAQRKPSTNVTILSGDIGTVGNAADNAYHVVYALSLSSNSILDGFTITGGNANVAYPDYWGGGLYNSGGNPALRNLIFTKNHSSLYGGGVFNDHGAPTLYRVTFNINTATSGGGMYNLSGNAVITDVTFNGNSATAGTGNSGGGLTNDASNSALTFVTFSNNFASDNGGAIYNEAGSSPILVDVTFSGNDANGAGGAIYNSGSSPTLTHVTLSGNLAGGAGDHMYNASGSSPTIVNSIFAGSADIADDGSGAASLSYSISQAGCAASALSCSHVFTNDPKLGPLQYNSGFTKTMALGPGSYAIDTALFASCRTPDQRHVKRPQGGGCDMGAYEVKARFFYSTDVYDGQVLESGKGSNVGGTANSINPTFLVGDDKLNRRFRGILSFDSSPLPDTGATIVFAAVVMTRQNIVGDPSGTQGDLVADLTKEYFGTQLSLVASDYQAPAKAYSVGTAFSQSGGVRYQITLKSTVLDLINKFGKTQLRLRFLTEQYNGAADYLSFYSGNNSNTLWRPVLWVYYNP